MRRFEFQEGTSHKFWEVYVAGDTLAVRFGKVGTQGQTQTKEFKSEDAAQRAAEKLVQVAVMLAEGKRPLPYPAILQTLRTLRAPVREVYLDGFERVSDTLEPLATQGLPPTWKVLAFEEGWGNDFESDEVRAVLQRHASAFRGLEVLGLPDDIDVEGAPVPTRPTEELHDRFTSRVYADW